MALTPRKHELWKELADRGGINELFEAVELKIATEWRLGTDLEARELSHAKLLALRDVRREVRIFIGIDDGG